MAVLIGVFFGMVLLRVVLVGAFALAVVRPVSSCPACFSRTTLPIRPRWHRLLPRAFEWRWCPSCGWQAIALAHAWTLKPTSSHLRPPDY
jgi:hypothetical protein